MRQSHRDFAQLLAIFVVSILGPGKLEALPESLADFETVGAPRFCCHCLLQKFCHVEDVAVHMQGDAHTARFRLTELHPKHTCACPAIRPLAERSRYHWRSPGGKASRTSSHLATRWSGSVGKRKKLSARLGLCWYMDGMAAGACRNCGATPVEAKGTKHGRGQWFSGEQGRGGKPRWDLLLRGIRPLHPAREGGLSSPAVVFCLKDKAKTGKKT